MNKEINFETKAPITYVDKKLGVILTLKCYGKITIDKDEDVLDSFLKHIQKVFNYLSEELSYDELLTSLLVKEVFIEYYNNLWKRKKINVLKFNLSSVVPTKSSLNSIVKIKKQTCPKCGFKIDKKDLFCSECGFKL